jgi:arginine N-succinyltransferase
MTLLRVRATLLEAVADHANLPTRRWRADLERHDATTGWQGPMATLTISARIGEQTPCYWFYLGTMVHSAPALGLHRQDRMMVLGSDFTGASQWQEIQWHPGLESHQAAEMLTTLLLGTLALAPDLRMRGEDQPSAPVIVAVPGVMEENRSPFWDGFGRHFYDGDRGAEIDRLGIDGWRSEVASLLPQQPVLVSLLSPTAQSTLGRAAIEYAPLEAALRAARFSPSRHVSIDDGGPVYSATPDDRDEGTPQRIQVKDSIANPNLQLLVDATQKMAALVSCSWANDGLTIDGPTARALGLHPGSEVRCFDYRPLRR